MNTNPTALRAIALLATLSCLAAGGCITFGSPGASSTATLRASVALDPSRADGAPLAVRSNNGRIGVRHDPALQTIEVEAEVRCAGETEEEAEERAAKARILATTGDDGTVRVGIEYPPMRSGRARHPSDGAAISVRAARSGALDLETSNGAISVEGMAGPLRAETGNGSITVERHDGSVRLSTSNGAIRATQVGLPAVLDTSNGRIEAEFSTGASGAVNARTSNGAVQLVLPADWSGTVAARTSNGRITMEGGARATSTEVDRGAGTMVIGPAAEATARAEVVTSNGAVRVRVGG